MKKTPLSMYRKVELIRLGIMAPFAIIMTADRWYTLLLALVVLTFFFYRALFSKEPSTEEQKRQNRYEYKPIHKLTDPNMGVGSLDARKHFFGF